MWQSLILKLLQTRSNYLGFSKMKICSQHITVEDRIQRDIVHVCATIFKLSRPRFIISFDPQYFLDTYISECTLKSSILL